MIGLTCGCCLRDKHRMGRLQEMTRFVAVVDAGSFAGATNANASNLSGEHHPLKSDTGTTTTARESRPITATRRPRQCIRTGTCRQPAENPAPAATAHVHANGKPRVHEPTASSSGAGAAQPAPAAPVDDADEHDHQH